MHNNNVQFLKRKKLKKEAYARDYPEFLFETNGAPRKFVDLVHSAVNKIDFDDPYLFNKNERMFIKYEKQNSEWMKRFREEAKGDPEKLDVVNGFRNLIAEKVYSFIPKDQLLEWIPYNDVYISQHGPFVIVVFRSLEKVKSEGGTAYYSRHKHTLKVGEKDLIVSWSDHAIKRVCQRMNECWQSYSGLGDVFSYFEQCVHYEKVTLDGDQLAFTFYAPCNSNYTRMDYVKNVLGTDQGHENHYENYYTRVGYCPAVIEGDFIKAITLLIPGFKKTPENELIAKAKISRDEKRDLFNKVDQMTLANLSETKDFSVLKWFHDNGIPQVIYTEDKIFKSMGETLNP